MKKLFIITAMLSYTLLVSAQQEPVYKKQGFFKTKEDFLSGKITEQDYKQHTSTIAVFRDAAGKKSMLKNTEIYGFTVENGELWIQNPLDDNKFHHVFLAGEINFYNDYGMILKSDKELSYLEGTEKNGYISKGYQGEWYAATEENFNKLIEGDFDCAAVAKAMAAKGTVFQLVKGKPNILSCVWAYNRLKLEDK